MGHPETFKFHYFQEPLAFKLDEEILGRCIKFADQMVEQKDFYKKRSGESGNPKIIRRQQFYSKMAECAAARYCHTDLPDFQIYTKEKKSFGADLGKNIIVKSCERTKYAPSWTFQVSSKTGFGGKDTLLFGAEPARVMLFECVVDGKDLYKSYPLLRCSLQNHFAVKMLRKMRLPIYHGVKEAIYLSTLREYHSDLRTYMHA
jgi:hypothetical protein